jgi:hypothetical protein
MGDKKCPNCGLWNSGVAMLCDCGYDFTTHQIPAAVSQNRSVEMNSALSKGALYGMLGAFLAALPVSILKTWIMIVLGGCGPLLLSIPGFPVGLNRCGPIYVPQRGGQLYLILVLLAGALSGALATFAFLKQTGSQPIRRSPPGSRQLFWIAFSGGVLFDLVFVFIFLYLGQ